MAAKAHSRRVDYPSDRVAVAKRVDGASSGAGSCRARRKFGKLGGEPSLQTGQASMGYGVWYEAAMVTREGSKFGAGSVKGASLNVNNGPKIGPKKRVSRHTLSDGLIRVI